MNTKPSVLAGLTDEEILDEFVKRFECDGAIIVYLESNTEFGFARWANTIGRRWANNLFTAIQNNNSIPNCIQSLCEAESLSVETIS